jgi:hypothetical protein
MIKVEQTSGSLAVDTSTPSFKIENVDIYSESFFLSQFQVYREDKEVTHVPNKTI